MGSIGRRAGGLVLAGKERVVDLERIRRAVREILLAVGEDPEREGFAKRPIALRECMPRFSRAFIKIRASI